MFQIDFNNPIHVYFIGIGGISMSGLAHVLLSEGFTVSGSDREASPLTEELSAGGARIYYGQRAENLDCHPDLIVYTSAIKEDNPEFIAGKAQNIPFLSRAQLLGQMMRNYNIPIAVSGTHGKTTTTSMLSQILLEADTDPTLSIGGIFSAIGSNIRVGGPEYFVTEACEYTDSFLSLFPKIGLILSVEADHLDYFGDLAHVRRSFRAFAELLPADGCLVINGEIENVSEFTDGLSCKVITYGSKDSDYMPTDISYDAEGHPSFTLVKKDGTAPDTYTLAVPGLYNVYNATAAIATARALGIDHAVIKQALLHFSGADRRFQYKGTCNGFTIIDDYAHHPTEIKAALEAGHQYPHKKLWCVFQPHTYTRTRDFLEDFAEALCAADEIVLADIYAARETDTLGVSAQTLQEAIERRGHACYYFPSFSEIENFLLKNCTKGDLLITMGAGDVVKIGDALLAR